MTRATSGSETLTVHVPFRIVKRGGRKAIHLPADAPQHRETDNTLIKALAEPPRVCRRPFGLSYAAAAGSSSMP